MEICIFLLVCSCNHVVLEMLFKVNCMVNIVRTKVHELMIGLTL